MLCTDSFVSVAFASMFVKVLSKAERAYKCHITRVQDSANTGGKVNMKGTMEMLVL